MKDSKKILGLFLIMIIIVVAGLPSHDALYQEELDALRSYQVPAIKMYSKRLGTTIPYVSAIVDRDDNAVQLLEARGSSSDDVHIPELLPGERIVLAGSDGDRQLSFAVEAKDSIKAIVSRRSQRIKLYEISESGILSPLKSSLKKYRKKTKRKKVTYVFHPDEMQVGTYVVITPKKKAKSRGAITLKLKERDGTPTWVLSKSKKFQNLIAGRNALVSEGSGFQYYSGSVDCSLCEACCDEEGCEEPSPSPSASAEPSPGASESPYPSSSSSPSPTASVSPSPSPTATSSPYPTASVTPSPTEPPGPSPYITPGDGCYNGIECGDECCSYDQSCSPTKGCISDPSEDGEDPHCGSDQKECTIGLCCDLNARCPNDGDWPDESCQDTDCEAGEVYCPGGFRGSASCCDAETETCSSNGTCASK